MSALDVSPSPSSNPTRARNFAFERAMVRVPGKIFILGEYDILKGGPALVSACAGSEGRLFEARVFLTSSPKLNGLHRESPAGRLLAWAYEKLGVSLEIHWGSGFSGGAMAGLGSSTAEFAVCYEFLSRLFADRAEFQNGEFGFWQSYRELTRVSSGDAPSGADLLVQVKGAATLVSIDPALSSPRYEKLTAHPEIQSSLIVLSAAHQKDRKIPTHEHLRTLEKIAPQLEQQRRKLREITLEGVRAWSTGEISLLGRALNEFGNQMQSLGLESHATTQDRQALAAVPGVYGVKGSGAMQADLLVVCADFSANATVVECARKRNLNVVSVGLPRVQGIEFKIEGHHS